MTLIFGGSPTPDRNQVSAIVECWIALVNLFVANVPTRDFIVVDAATARSRRWTASGFAASSRRQRSDEPIVRVLIVRLAAMAGDAFGAQL